MPRQIIYVGPFSFPSGGAAARRIVGNVKSMQFAGFDVSVACGQGSSDRVHSSEHDGIKYFWLNERIAEKLPRALKHAAYVFMGRKTVDWLDSLEKPPYAIVLYSGYSPYLLRLIPWAKRRNVRLIFDAVEWYDPDSRLGWLSPYQLNIELAMRFLVPKVGNVISISHYLDDYYTASECNSLIVPPTLDLSSVESRVSGRTNGEPLKLVYAGSPGKKDLLNNILETVFRLREDGVNVQITVAGVSPEEAALYQSVSSRLDSTSVACAKFLGHISHGDSMELVRSSDYSLLLRNDARYSRAGFSTKFVESMAVGTPVIANITGDLYNYLQDGLTGFVCAGPSPDQLEVALRRALSLDSIDVIEIRERCRNLAVKSFDFRNYSSKMSNFLESIKV